MNKQVVVRFAPSPTGYLHIGGARTAIFNWLYAKKHNGKFILRIEDTDAERSTEDSIEGIVNGMKWLGLDWDEGPNFQTSNIEKHNSAAKKLIQTGHAYKCFCSKETIDQQREQARSSKQTYKYDQTCRELLEDEIAQRQADGIPYAVRLKIPQGDGSVIFDDSVCGTIEKKYSDLEDFIIVRSNGKPLYILSNAVDDIEDKVTHIIRGQDGLANTPKQVLIYNALNAPLPVFAHMSLTLDPQKRKISKRRHGEMVAVHTYREMGFLPWAFVNFLVLLGWATKESKEIFSQQELIEAFTLEGISKANSVFNINQDDSKFFTDPKLLNINNHYLKTMPVEELAEFVKKQLESKGLYRAAWDNEEQENFFEIINLIRERFHVLTDFTEKGIAWFSDEFPIDEKALKKNILPYPDLKTALPELAGQIKKLDSWNEKDLEKTLKEMLGTLSIKPGTFVNAIRLAMTGQAVGPDFMKSLIILGQGKVVERLEKSCAMFDS